MYRFPRTMAVACAIACLGAWPSAASAQEDQSREPWEQDQQADDQGRQQQDQKRQQQDRQREQQDEQRQQRERDQQQSNRDSNDQGSDDAAIGVALSRGSDSEVRIERVYSGSPAQDMGLRDGDVIVSVNGERVESNEDLMREIENRNPGDEIRLEIERDGNRQDISGELESRRQAFESRRPREGRRSFSRVWRGESSDRGGYTSSQSDGGHRDLSAQLDSLERQVNQIQRELANLRQTIREGGDQGNQQAWSESRNRGRVQDSERGRESAASYEDYDNNRRTGERTSYDRSSDGNRRSNQSRSEIHASPGGEVGEERMRTTSEDISEQD